MQNCVNCNVFGADQLLKSMNCNVEFVISEHHLHGYVLMKRKEFLMYECTVMFPVNFVTRVNF